MTTTLDVARKERETHVQAIARLDKVIALLTDQRVEPATPAKKKKRRTSPEARERQSASMKASWATRRKKSQLSEENRQAADGSPI